MNWKEVLLDIVEEVLIPLAGILFLVIVFGLAAAAIVFVGRLGWVAAGWVLS